MSEFAYFRFLSLKLLTPEEEKDKDGVINATEQVLAAQGKECDEACAKMSEAEAVKLVEEMRKIYLIDKKRKKKQLEGSIEVEEEQHDEKETVYAGTG